MKKKIKIPIYTGNLLIVQETSLDGVFKKYADREIDGEYHALVVKVYERGVMTVIIAFEEKDITIPIIAHECLHAVNEIFETHGVSYTLDNDEHAAYLLGWLVEKCIKYVKYS